MVDGPDLEKRDVIKLLVEQIVVDYNGEIGILTKVPLYIPPCPGSPVPLTNATRSANGGRYG